MFFLKIFHSKIQSFIKVFFKKKIFKKTPSSGFKLFSESFFSHPVWEGSQKSVGKLFYFTKKNRKPLIILLVAFLMSDLLLIKSYNLLLPDRELPPLAFLNRALHKNLSTDLYKNIWENNIFHIGHIPLQLKEKFSINLDPVLSSLPFRLKGTIIHIDSRRSVATITAGTDKKTLSYQQGDLIAKQAEIREIQRAKVVFFNQNNNRLEYILIPEEIEKLPISYAKPKPKAGQDSLVKKTGSNRFQVKRSDINESLLNLPEILLQARVVPHPEGWEFASIDKASMFEDLGFEKGDILKEVNGEPVRTPEKALELFDKLKKESGIKILVQREGKNMHYEYTVREDSAPIK